MIHIIANSVGKDSQAVLIWAKKNLQEFKVGFCDTKWESPITYDHLEYQQKWLGQQFNILTSKKYDGFIDLCIQKKRVASTKGRFCTEKLKVEPFIDFILQHNDDITIYQGVRNDESEARRSLQMNDEYFKFYFQPFGYDKNGKPKMHSYRRKEVLEYCNEFTVDVHRPVIKWTAEEVIAYSLENNVKLNPLYFNGFGRVGCFPCVMCRHSEIKLIAERYPQRIEDIRRLERAINRTFFPPGYIPAAHCDRKVINKRGVAVYFATIDAVLKYVMDNPNQQQLFAKNTGCISVYNICEATA